MTIHRRIGCAVLLAVTAAACSGGDNKSSSSGVDATIADTNGGPASVGSESVDAPEQTLPEGVQLRIPYVITSDRVVLEEAGGKREITMEYFAGTQDDVVDVIGAEMSRKGFVERAQSRLESGSIRTRFAKAQIGMVIVKVSPIGTDGLVSEGAVGAIEWVWPAAAPAEDSGEH